MLGARGSGVLWLKPEPRRALQADWGVIWVKTAPETGNKGRVCP